MYTYFLIVLFHFLDCSLDYRLDSGIDVRKPDAVQIHTGLGRCPGGPYNFTVAAGVRAVGEKEREKNPVAFRKEFLRPDEHSLGADIFRIERTRLILECALNGHGQRCAVEFPGRNVQELPHLAVKQNCIDGHGEDRVGAAPLALFAVVKRVLADDDGGNLAQRLAYPERFKEFFALHVGHVELRYDEVDPFLPVDLQHPIVRVCGVYRNVGTLKKTVFSREKVL